MAHYGESLLSCQVIAILMAQVLRSLELGVLSVIMLIAIVALSTELVEYEEIAKVVVIPSLALLIAVTAYSMFMAYRQGGVGTRL